MTYTEYNSQKSLLKTAIIEAQFDASYLAQRSAHHKQLLEKGSARKTEIHAQWKATMSALHGEKFNHNTPGTELLVISRKLAYNDHWKHIMDAQVDLDVKLGLAEWDEARRIEKEEKIAALKAELDALEEEAKKYQEAWQQERAESWRKENEERRNTGYTTTNTEPNPETKKLHRQYIRQFHPDKYTGKSFQQQLVKLAEKVNVAADRNDARAIEDLINQAAQLIA